MLHSTTSGQLLIFLSYIFWGIIVSFGFQFTMRIVPKKFFAVAIAAEIIYGAAATAGLWYVNFVFNDGQVRLYIFLGLALGVLIYCKICAAPLDKLFNSLYNRVTKKWQQEKDNEKDIPQ